MLKIICLILSFFVSKELDGQGFIAIRNNGPIVCTERYVQGAITWTVEQIKDSTKHRLYNKNIIIDRLNSVRNDGIPATIIYSTGAGSLNVCPATNLINVLGIPVSTLQSYWNNKMNLSDTSLLNLQARLNLFYLSSNPNSFISSITGIMVTSALTYSPYNATNPAGYINGISNSDVTTALGFTPYNATNPAAYISTVTVAQVTAATGGTPVIQQTKVNSGANTSVTGSFPNFTINATTPTITGTGLANITGTYPTLTVTATYVPTLTVNGSILGATGGNTITLPTQISQYNITGTVAAITKELNAVISPTTSNSYTINISSAGFSNIIGAPQITAAKNTTVVAAAPVVWIKSFTNTQVVVSIVESNTASSNALITLIGALGSFLTGPPNIYADITGLTLHLCIKGN